MTEDGDSVAATIDDDNGLAYRGRGASELLFLKNDKWNNHSLIVSY